MQFVRNSLNFSIRWSEITLIDISNWYSVSVCTNCPAEVIHILFSFLAVSGGATGPCKWVGMPQRDVGMQELPIPPLCRPSTLRRCRRRPLYIQPRQSNYAHPCLINMPPQRLRWILRVCANKPCKHIPQTIGDQGLI